ncbi:MAG: EAL domain-containing protein [Pseudomonas sp.]|uniref:EAL domain-containing protein n=1 Tax=Pseudomonas sp. TaxID=306 RepID=UPI0027347CB0|nr:EAL domain-containing protein [Pseudomonas sp.]MDP3846823.1 EAL domain-containing protein [Pseudomonas sp.]
MPKFFNRTAMSLARRIQVQIGLVIALAIIAVTLLSYQYSISSMRKQALEALSNQVSARTALDSETFVQAQQNTYLLRDEYLLRLKQTAEQDPRAEFEHWFVRYPDGLIRVRPELDDYKHLPSIYIRSQVTLTTEIRRQVLVAFKLLREWGAPMTMRYYSAYIDLPGIALIMYSPSVNWGQESNSNSNNFDYPPVRNSSPENNPQRLNSWTEVYFDDKAAIWMLSTITPADQASQWVGTVSQDISIEALVKRTSEQQSNGSFNLIIDEKNRLLVHPQLMEKIRSSEGSLQLAKLADPLLQDAAKLAYASTSWPSVAESSDGDYYLGIGRIEGPNWYSISVYPKALLAEKAFASAGSILLAGLAGLAIELLLLAWIIRRQVAKPLRLLQSAVQSIAAGELNVKLPSERRDELGELANNFAHMVEKLRARDLALTARASELELEVQHRQTAEAARLRLSDRLSIATEVAGLGVWEWDHSNQQAYWDAQTFRLYGLEPFSIKASERAWLDMVVPDDRKRVLHAIREGINGPLSRYEIEYGLVWANGEVHFLSCICHIGFDRNGNPTRLTGVQIDITERKLAEQRILHMATHDSLTGLANRMLLTDRLQQVLLSNSRKSQMSALLFIDLDHFKQINDTLGHIVGDELLKFVGNTLQNLVRKSDTVARLGGDEFVLLLPQIEGCESAIRVADKIIQAMAAPLHIEGASFTISPSIGISLYPDDGLDAETLLRNADIAMYRAKSRGRNNYQCYTADMGEIAAEVMRLEVALRHAAEQQEFELYYQPKVAADSQRIIGAEALIRWNREGQGQVPPDKFIPFAEQRNLMLGIDQYVLRQACSQLRQWLDAEVPALPVAVNLSSGHFGRELLLAELQALLDEFALPANLLQLEVTEGLLLQESETVYLNLIGLRQLGIKISLDDFGTGYSSLSYLHRFPVDQLKIDRSFVSKLSAADHDAPLVSAIIGIGHSLNLSVIAEGVETCEQAELLQRLACDELQGYYFSRPLPAQDYANRLLTQTA